MTARLMRLACGLRATVWLGIALLLVVPTLGWFEPSAGIGLMPRLRPAELDPATKWLAFVLAMPPYLVVALGLGQLDLFCRRIRDARLFTAAAAATLRRFGLSLLLASALLPLSRAAVWLAVADTGLPLPTLPILAAAMGALFGLLLVLFAGVLGESARLADENASFV